MPRTSGCKDTAAASFTREPPRAVFVIAPPAPPVEPEEEPDVGMFFDDEDNSELVALL